MTEQGDQRVVLLVEDDPGHAQLIQKNLLRSGLATQVEVLRDGGEAVDYFFGAESKQHKEQPQLILLDLNLPRVDGYQVLARIKGHEQTRQIPVAVLTTTADRREVARCYELGCNLFLTKPVDYVNFAETIQTLGKFLKLVEKP
jgi:CheY-like chemotaxis protein